VTNGKATGKSLGQGGGKDFGVRIRFLGHGVLDELPEGAFVHVGERAAWV
jgi:hypothetical protein